jgi:phosphohistidine swiveling domain-containing protein
VLVFCLEFELLFKFASYPVLLSELTFKPYSFFDIKIVSLNNRAEIFASKKSLDLAAEKGFLRAQDSKTLVILEKDAAMAGEELLALRKKSIEKFSAKELVSFLHEFDEKANALFAEYLFTEYPFFRKVEQVLLQKVSGKELQDLLSSTSVPENFSASELNCLDYLRKLQKIKLEIRKKYINCISVDSNSLFERGCKRLIEVIGKTDIQNFTINELKVLLAGKKVPFKMDREKASVVKFIKNKIIVVSGAEAEKEIKVLQKPISSAEFFGTPANQGIASGKAIVIQYLDIGKLQKVIASKPEKFILVADSAGPEFTSLFHKALAVVADEGGLMSHAAVLTREFGIPGVVGTRHATKAFKDGDLIEVNGFTGKVRKLNEV